MMYLLIISDITLSSRELNFKITRVLFDAPPLLSVVDVRARRSRVSPRLSH